MKDTIEKQYDLILAFYKALAELSQQETSLENVIGEAISSFAHYFSTKDNSLWLEDGGALVCVSSQDSAGEYTRYIPLTEMLHPLVQLHQECTTSKRILSYLYKGREQRSLFWRGECLGVLVYTVTTEETNPRSNETVDVAIEMLSQFVADYKARETLKKSEKALRDRVDELETIFKLSPIGIAITHDTRCDKIRVNPAAAVMLGVGTQEYYSKSSPFGARLGFKVLSNGRELSSDELPLQRAARGGDYSSELRLDIVHNDGRVFHLFEYCCPLHDEKNVVRGAIGFFVDVTPLHRAEEQLQKQLQEVSLANERKNQFLAVLSHELRNPLSAVKSASQILGRPDLHDHHLWALTLLERQVKTMTKLIEDLLDASRIGQNKMRLDLQPIDLQTTINNAIEVAQVIVDEKRQKVITQLPAKPILVSGDGTRLEQVIGNLITNAAKYSDEGGTIIIGLGQDEQFAKLSVKDNGIGIEKEQLAKVFDIFMQVLPNDERSRGGLGLGLSLVKRLTELHGGKVHVESDGEGKGSTFTVFIPLLRTEIGGKKEKGAITEETPSKLIALPARAVTAKTKR